MKKGNASSKETLLNNDHIINLLFRTGIFLTFFGHGYVAINKNINWIPYLEVFGFSKEMALNILPIIGTVDIIVALIILIKPFNAIVLWAALWAFSTALVRPISGEPIFSFIERGANWILPLLFFLYTNHKHNFKK